ncbi:MAG: porin family protein [Marinifilaceae bacterium]
MKNLMKFAIAIVLVATTFLSNAQIKFGVKVGLNLADIAQNFKDSEVESDTKMLTGYAFGVTAEYEIQEKWALQSGVMLTRKGYKVENSSAESNWSESYERKYKVNYLEVPVNIAYKMNDFQLYAGPYVAFGISGKVKEEWTETYNGETESDSFECDIKFKSEVGEEDFDDDNDDEYMRGFDYGLNFGVGYQTGPMLFNVGYSLGLANLTPDKKGEDGFDAKDYKSSNRVLSFSVSYFFGKK